MQETKVALPLPNRDQSLLKLVAIITMIIDHTGIVFFPGERWLRMIGRIAFPLFCWGIVIGAERTRSVWKYALRLLILAVASQYPYMLALKHSLMQFNVIVTLLLGFLSIVGMRNRWYFSQIWAPALALVLSAMFQMDYGWRGVLLIILMHLARNSCGGLAALMIAFCLGWEGGGVVWSHSLLSLVTSTPIEELNRALGTLLGLVKLQTLAIFALPLMLINTNSGMRLPKWVSYLAYPGHLMILWLIEILLASFNQLIETSLTLFNLL